MVHITKPNYWYFNKKTGEILSRYKCQKHLLKEMLDSYDENKTEYENMISNGYWKFSDSGNLKMKLIDC